MTTLRPGPGRPAIAPNHVVVLGEAHRPALERLVAEEPVVNAMAAARLDAARLLTTTRLGAIPLGVGDTRRLCAAAFAGGNLVPIGDDPTAWPLLASRVARRPRECTSIVGPAGAVHAMWEVLRPVWGAARAVRESQPLLVATRADGLPRDPRLRALHRAEIERYLPAAAAMFTEELGVSPLIAATAGSYRRRAERLLAAGRVFGIVDATGAIVFKADIGAVTAATCQIQGVWVRPELRGQGIATAAMAEVLRRALELAPTASLYVNDFNTPARCLYARLGMRQIAELATVLF